MPYEFKHSSDVNDFHCNLTCKRCEGENKNGTQCKLQVCIGLPYCWRHMRSKLQIKIARSTIPNSGNGVFAYNPSKNIVFKKGDFICYYDGELINQAEVNRRYSEYDTTAPYTYHIGATGDNYVDAACERGIGGMLNFKTYTGRRNPNNAKGRKHGNKVKISALKDIRHGDEIFLDYGMNYNVELNQELHERHSTNYVRPRRRQRRR
jgi:SET domain-containing protein